MRVKFRLTIFFVCNVLIRAFLIAPIGQIHQLMTSKKFESFGISSSLYCDKQSMDERIASDPNLQSFLKGPEGKPWKGTRDILARKGQVPSESYTPQDVVRICLQSLQNNDEPQLDHGAAVVMEFKSPRGILAQGNLDPASYGRFLRSGDYCSLIDYKSYEFEGSPQAIGESFSVKQSVKISNWSISDRPASKKYDFFLSKVGSNWLIDAIVVQP